MPSWLCIGWPQLSEGFYVYPLLFLPMVGKVNWFGFFGQSVVKLCNDLLMVSA